MAQLNSSTSSSIKNSHADAPERQFACSLLPDASPHLNKYYFLQSSSSTSTWWESLIQKAMRCWGGKRIQGNKIQFVSWSRTLSLSLSLFLLTSQPMKWWSNRYSILCRSDFIPTADVSVIQKERLSLFCLYTRCESTITYDVTAWYFYRTALLLLLLSFVSIFSCLPPENDQKWFIKSFFFL